MKNGMRKIHPGEVLKEEFLVPLDMDENELAEKTGIPLHVIIGLVMETRGVNDHSATQLAKHFGTSKEFWTNLQKSYDDRKV
jgi:addiction module HigA family antidote